MNINKYTINSLLKFTLTFGIVLTAVNSISVNTAVRAECFTDSSATDSTDSQAVKEAVPDVNNETPATKKELNDLNKCFVEKIDSSIDTIKTDYQTQFNNIEKNLDNNYKNNSLIFIDLPILATLLLCYLTQKKQQQQIDKLTKNQNKILSNFSQFNEITNKLNNLDRINRHIAEKIQDSDQKNLDSEIRLREFISKQQFNQSVNHHNSLTSDISHFNSIAIVDKIVQLAKTYNQDKTSLSNKAIATVAETQESLNQRRSGSSDIVTLENTTQKKYCVIEEDNDYYLLPHAKIKIDEYNKTTLESLFDCSNFTSEYSDFQLVKPAKVSQLSSETWQLEEKGQLDFY